MKSLFLSIICLRVFLFSFNINAQNTDDVKQIIIKKYEKVRTTLKNGDPNYVLEMHANNAILFLQNGTEVVGMNALKPFYAKVALTGIDIESTPTAVELLSDTTAFQVGIFTSTTKTGKKNAAKYINIWKKIDGDWKLYKAIDQAKL